MATSVYSLTISYNVQGQFASNILHYVFDDGAYNSTFAAGLALIDRWKIVALPALKLMLPTLTVILSIKSKRVSIVGGFEAIEVLPAATHGARAGSLQVAGVGPIVVTYEINNGKRRGKIFLPGITEADVVEGQIVAGARNAMTAQLSTLLSNLTLVGGGAPTAQYCIYHAATHSYVLIANSAISLVVGTQRRRQVPV
jgi:hypothetical protein